MRTAAWRVCLDRASATRPLYIIIAELVIGASLGPLARMALQSRSWGMAILAGLLGGLVAIGGGLVGYGLMERIL